MSFEEEISGLNRAYFFREFTYSNSRFRYRAENDVENEVELADNRLWLGNDLIIYQLKERGALVAATADEERNWFEKKILQKATRQIRDTLRYLESQVSIPLTNHRGHQFILNRSSIVNIQKLVVFKPDAALPAKLANIKYHDSSTAGIIHLLCTRDYKGVIQTLITPAEFMEYLVHRERLIKRWGDHVNSLPEHALLGHYISECLVDERPNIAHARILLEIDHKVEQWDISGIIRLYADRITRRKNSTDYYAIVTTLAQMHRGELEQFKLRYVLSCQKAKTNEFALPYRVAYPRLDCGFVFIPLMKEAIPHRGNALRNFTLAHKYDQRLSRCIGLTFAKDGPEHYTVEWCLISYPWVREPEIEERLANDNPFREVRSTRFERYSRRESEET